MKKKKKSVHYGKYLLVVGMELISLYFSDSSLGILHLKQYSLLLKLCVPH